MGPKLFLVCVVKVGVKKGTTPKNHPLLTQGFTSFRQGGLCGGSCENRTLFLLIFFRFDVVIVDFYIFI